MNTNKINLMGMQLIDLNQQELLVEDLTFLKPLVLQFFVWQITIIKTLGT